MLLFFIYLFRNNIFFKVNILMIYDYYLQQHMFIFIYEKTKTFLQHLRFRLSPSCQKKNAYIVQMKKTFFFFK